MGRRQRKGSCQRTGSCQVTGNSSECWRIRPQIPTLATWRPGTARMRCHLRAGPMTEWRPGRIVLPRQRADMPLISMVGDGHGLR